MSISPFLMGCIPVRILLVLLAKSLSGKGLYYFGFSLLLIGFSFLYLFVTKGRLYAPEAGGITWWNNLRIFHAALYLLAGYSAIMGDRSVAVTSLSVDVLAGLTFFMLHHYTNLLN